MIFHKINNITKRKHFRRKDFLQSEYEMHKNMQIVEKNFTKKNKTSPF